MATGFLAETSCYASEDCPSRIKRRVAGHNTVWEVVKASLPHIVSRVQTRFCTKTPRGFSRASATRYTAEMCVGLCVHRRLETAICCTCRHDILCIRALFGFLLAIKDLTVLWRQQSWRKNDVNSDNQQKADMTRCYPVKRTVAICTILNTSSAILNSSSEKTKQKI